MVGCAGRRQEYLGRWWPAVEGARLALECGVARLKPATAKQITDWAAKLEGKGIVLVPVSAAVRSQAQG